MDQVTYLLHHVFLPPKLPGGDDFSADNDLALLQSVVFALEAFHSLCDASMAPVSRLAARSRASPSDNCQAQHGCGGFHETVQGLYDFLHGLYPGESAEAEGPSRNPPCHEREAEPTLSQVRAP